ncbi:sulfite exporter TauE/SafE family protein, partial [Vibrio anguillarum]|nr:sulfite exporter TauE/SafE family protein [Vibrio anguillarum]MBF4377289.1 sulfite exporter TauE/SafE family protein [Vibrio anguillarum]
MIISDPWFYVTAIPAVLIFGIGKGGLGGALGVVAVPLMSLSVSSTQAAA